MQSTLPSPLGPYPSLTYLLRNDVALFCKHPECPTEVPPPTVRSSASSNRAHLVLPSSPCCSSVLSRPPCPLCHSRYSCCSLPFLHSLALQRNAPQLTTVFLCLTCSPIYLFNNMYRTVYLSSDGLRTVLSYLHHCTVDELHKSAIFNNKNTLLYNAQCNSPPCTCPRAYVPLAVSYTQSLSYSTRKRSIPSPSHPFYRRLLPSFSPLHSSPFLPCPFPHCILTLSPCPPPPFLPPLSRPPAHPRLLALRICLK